MAKLKNGLSGKTPTTLVSMYEFILLMLTGNLYFPATVPTLANLTAKSEALKTAINLAKKGDKEAVAERTKLFKELKQMIRELVSWLQTSSLGDPVKLATTGFEMMKAIVPIGFVDTPKNLRQMLFNFPGKIKVRCDKAVGADLYIYQRCVGNPEVEANWVNAGSTKRTYFIAENQPALTNIYWRMASVGTVGQSDWSDPIKTVCLQ